MSLPVIAAVAGLVAVELAACGAAAPAPSGGQKVEGPVTVFAAASLTGAFHDVAGGFHEKYPAATVRLNFGGSAALATQIDQGAPADVFASADEVNLQKVVTAGNTAAAPAVFAANRLQIVVRPGNPKGVRTLADLAAPGLVTVLCAPVVPCGNYAAQVLARAGVKVVPMSQEQDVTAVVSRVAMGEADAGIVYATDVRAAGGRVAGVDIPDAQNVRATYPVAPIRGGPNPGGATAFIAYLLSPAGQDILARYGFVRP